MHANLVGIKEVNEICSVNSLYIYRINIGFISLIYQHILTQLQATTLLEWLAFIFGVAQVVLALKNKIINFYAGIISVAMYTYLFYDVQLYAESLLNMYYFIVSVVGILLWQKRKNETALPISICTKKEWAIVSSILCISGLFLYFILKKYTQSTVPFADALTTAWAWAGTWLMIKRKLENWILLNISNAIAIPLQFIKGLELTSLLTCIYFVIAILGFIAWRKQMKEIV